MEAHMPVLALRLTALAARQRVGVRHGRPMAVARVACVLDRLADQDVIRFGEPERVTEDAARQKYVEGVREL